MSNYKAHLIGGLIAMTIILLVLKFFFEKGFNAIFLLKALIITIIFSLLPDIDSKKSKINYLLHLTLIFFFVLLLFKIINLNLQTILLLGLLIFLELYRFVFSRNKKKHKKFPHTITFGILSLIVLFLFTNSVFLTLIGAGALISHFFLDNYFKWI